MSQRMKTAVIALIALLLVFSLVLPAFAHAQLLSSSPANGAALPTAEEVVLTFNESISPDFVQLAGTGPDGDIIEGDAVVDGPVLTQAIRATANGEYTLTYRVVSADGHPVSGEVTFTLTDTENDDAPDQDTGAIDTDATPTATASPSATAAASAAPTPDPVANPAPEGQDDGDDAGFGLMLPLTLGIVLVVVVGGALAWTARNRRHEH